MVRFFNLKKKFKTKKSPQPDKRNTLQVITICALVSNYYIHVWYGVSMRIKLGMQSNIFLDPRLNISMEDGYF
jgi:hypothetical protein